MKEKQQKLLELYQDLVEELGLKVVENELGGIVPSVWTLEVEDKVFSKSALNIYIKIKELENEI